MPGCYSYKFLIDGEWKNAPGFELKTSLQSPFPSGAEVEENEDGELVSVLIVEEEEEEDVVEEENGESCKEDKATISGEKGESAKADNILEERGQRRAAVGTN